MSHPRLRPLVVSMPLLGLALTGCGGSSTTTHTAVATSSYSDPAASQGAGAAGDLVKHTCTADAQGRWSFTGTLRNTSKQDADYTITLSLVHRVGSTVVATHEVTRKVAAGGTQGVEAPSFATEKGSKELACVVSTRARRS